MRKQTVKNLFTYLPIHLFTSKKIAFTLAEVLITLGIIGVVAAMTMPTLIQNHKKSVVETRLAKFYSVMNQAVQRAEVDYGDKKNWDEWKKITVENEDGTTTSLPDWDFFNKYFKPYLNTTKIEQYKRMIIVYFPDGSVAAFSPASIQFWPNGKDFGYLIDEETGEIINNMEASGRKYFTFFFNPSTNTIANKYHYGKGVEPYKLYDWDGTREMLLNNNLIGCKETVANERAFCTALIQMNGWKIPKDYPLRF